MRTGRTLRFIGAETDYDPEACSSLQLEAPYNLGPRSRVCVLSEQRSPKLWSLRVRCADGRPRRGSFASARNRGAYHVLITAARTASDDAMPRKKRRKKPRFGDVSGIAATLLHDKVAGLETIEYQKRAGKLIADAGRPKQKGAKRPRKRS
jgi:hypothetical protein